MSRTDVHRPFPIQMADPHNRHRVYRFHTWPTKVPELWPTYNICGCRMCTGHHWNRAERRHNRHQWKLKRRELLKLEDPE